MEKGNEKEKDYQFKLLLIGDSLVGKSCLITRYADDHFEPNFIATIGVDFKTKKIIVDGSKAKLQVWDTAGQERFCGITRSYYRGCDGIAVVYDVTNRESFVHVSKWLSELSSNTTHPVIRILIGNKSDLTDKRVVSPSEGKDVAEANNMPFYETSALTGDGVEEVFDSLCRSCKKQYDIRGGPLPPPETLRMDNKKKKRKCCGS